MDAPDLRQRRAKVPQGTSEPSMSTEDRAAESHPAGQVKHGKLAQALRLMLSVSWFVGCCVSLHVTQLFGCPLYLINRNYYYAYMALTKQSFGILMISITQWLSPTVIRVSGDKSVRGQLRLTSNGRLKTDFPERIVLIANHQLYSEWMYLWWVSYTSRMHGHIFIVLKEVLKYIPVIGPGMMFFGFIFVARNWSKDQERMRHRLQKLTSRHGGPLSGSQSLDPMWLLIFPEGTNLSSNTRKTSAKWAEKQGIADLKHQLLPRSTGLQYSLSELKGSIDWVYDCTLGYEGVPRDGYGQDYFTLRSTYLEGRPPKSVNMYWRRFAASTIPVDDPKAFEKWLSKVWLEKEALLEYFSVNDRFPADEGSHLEKTDDESGTRVQKGAGFIETEIRLGYTLELAQIFVIMAAYALVANVLAKFWALFMYGRT